MDRKIDAQELAEIVAETARIHEQESGSLDPEQAREVLRELELPADRLEDAQAAVALRRAHTHERAGRLKLGLALALMLGAGLGLLGWRAHGKSAALESMTTSQSELTLSGAPLIGAAARSAQPELLLEAVLANPPQGSALELSCDWLGPGHALRYQNRWQTKSVDKDAWPTHCRRRFSSADPSGEWSVQMKAGDRVLTTKTFELE